MSRFAVGVLIIVVALFPVTRGLAASCDTWAALVVSAQGDIEAKRRAQAQRVRVQLNDTYCAGDSIQTTIHSSAVLLLRNHTLLRLDHNTNIVLPEFTEEKPAWLELIRGAAHFISNIPYKLKVKTPFINGAIEGTEFAMRVTEKDTRIWVFEGKVVAENAYGRLILQGGDAAVAEAGKAPTPLITIKPRDAVQWALYYPPIIDYRPEITSDPVIQQAIDFYRSGQVAEAIATLGKVPNTLQDAHYFTLRAALLLSVGRVEQARNDINQAQTLEADNGTAPALLSIIALAQNQKEKALDLAQEAAKKDPQSPTPQVALSYAYQAAFDIEKARDSIKKALELSPDDSLAWARLSELELSLGELDDALEAAEKAAVLNPNLSRTQMVLGFAYLTQIDLDEAAEAFEKAIELDPAAPLPRLGQGLVKIRRGDVSDGTKDIEVAAMLDPDNSLVRSYLGKAYYEEKREGVARREFAIAKELDPKDPTPWFYDAILKQTENRPVEALHAIQKAIELNDNRAVYRSQLLLDDDLAARSASLGRIYNDLGFQQLGLVEGWKSVNADPSNYSAHRLLADNYAALPRHEIARVSELLQSQLLQPINITPVQPSLGESNLLILEGSGPSTSSFNEFNPLFTRNRLALQASGVFGNNDTLGDEVTQSGVWGRYSYSLGQFHFESDGFRENNDLTQDIYNVFAQVSLTPKFNVQAEFRHRETEHGDLELKFNLDRANTSFRKTERVTTSRLGAHYVPKPNMDFIASLIYQDKEEIERTSVSNVNTDPEAWQIEIQNQFHTKYFNTVVGLGYFDQNSETDVLIVPRNLRINLPTSSKHKNIYLYSTIDFPTNVVATLGASFDKFQTELGDFKRNQINPKFGLTWDVTSFTTLRMAAFRTLKRVVAASQTIEPTQVAGFNQFFDDVNATDSKRFGVAIDQRISKGLFAGLESSKRNIDVPRPALGDKDEQDEWLHHAYLFWTPSSRIAIGLEYQFEKFDREIRDSNPKKIRTHKLPIRLNYFHPNGLFVKLGTTYIDQEVTIGGSRSESDDQFWLVDLSLGYRLPKRWGLVSVDLRNLFDTSFNFQDRNFETVEIIAPPFKPERSVFANFNLAF